MDTAEEVCHLAKSSRDTFTRISSYISGHDLANLWLCGNKSVMHLLAHNPLEFNMVFAPGEPFPFGKLLKNFANLQVFRARCVAEKPLMFIAEIMLGGFPLESLPESVVKIELDFDNDFVSFLRFTSDSTPEKPQVELIDLKNILPNLKKLTCRSRQTTTNLPFVRGQSSLPDNFRELSLPHNPITVTSQAQIDELPSFIIQLRIMGDESSNSSQSFTLPSQLRLLKLSDLPFSAIKTLPSNLETLSWNLSSDTEEALTVEVAKKLPSTLRHLSIHGIPSISSDVWESLPSELTHLKLYIFGSPSWSDIKADLRRFKNLRAAYFGSLNEEVPWADVLSKLPPSITDFNIAGESVPSEYWSRLPKSIQTLRIERNLRTYDSQDEEDPDDAINGHVLPKSITNLEWPYPLPYLAKMDLPKLNTLTLYDLSGSSLPFASLTSLTTTFFALDPNVLKDAPCRLKSLSIAKANFDQISKFDLSWPSLASLAHLRLTNASVDADDPALNPFPKTTWPAGLKNSQLKSLELTINFQSSEHRIPATFLKELPSTLLYLNASPLAKLEPSDFDDLPPKLLKLDLRGNPNPELLKVRLYERLPKTIQYLQIPGYKFDGDQQAGVLAHFNFLSFCWSRSRITEPEVEKELFHPSQKSQKA